MSIEDCNSLECALSSIGELGLNVHEVGLFKRKWSEGKIGKGQPSDSLDLFSPQPRLSKIKLRWGIREGGTVKQGDLLVKLLTKATYPNESQINAASDDELEEIYYYVNGDLYEVIEVDEKLLYWNVTIRKTKKRELFLEV